MQNARIAAFEDSETIHRLIDRALIGSGHEVVTVRTSRESALAALDEMASGDLEADVVLLDGTLEHEQPGQMGEDAVIIFDRIRELNLPAKVIGISSFELEKFGVPVDIDLTKQNLASLADTIDEL